METFGPGSPRRPGSEARAQLRSKKSAAGEACGGRTHTFGLRRAGAELKTRAVYQRSNIVLSHGKPISRNGNGEGQACSLKNKDMDRLKTAMQKFRQAFDPVREAAKKSPK